MQNELEKILRDYEKANNFHDLENVEPFVHPNAIYWFTDGEYEGVEQIKSAITKTFEKIKEETYAIKDVNWLVTTDSVGVCIYIFHWEGIVDGEKKSGDGKGTNVFVKDSGNWKIIHEHLSK